MTFNLNKENPCLQSVSQREDIPSANGNYRRSARIRKIVESATEPPQNLENEDQTLVDGSQAIQNRASKEPEYAACGAKTASQSKEATDSSTTKGKSAVQSRKSRSTPRGSKAAAARRSHPRKKACGRPKLIADPIESTQQDLGSGTRARSPSILKPKITRPKGASGQTRGGPPKAPSTLVSKDSSLPLGSPQGALNWGSWSERSIVRSEPLDQSTALTREALEAHTLESAPIALADQIRAINRIFGRALTGTLAETRSSDTTDIDPQEEFSYKWGYLPPLGEEAEHIITAVLENPELVKIMVRIGPNSRGFRYGLEKRNVVISESRDPDPRADEIGGASLKGFLEETADQQQVYEDLWRLDRDKCNVSSSEALFQRTLMISLIAQHSLMYRQNTDETQLLNFVVEEPWNCLPMPTKAVWRVPEHRAHDFKFLTQPKPDLAVCFDKNLLLPEDIWVTLPQATQALACFENSDAATSRIFHFLTVEAKKAILNINEPKALHQSLNNASQALHNMFEFFRDAGPRHEEIFFEKVRFFSIVANGEGLLIRIHRAIQLSPKDSRLFVMPDEPNYRLRFVYRTFESIKGIDQYNRARVLEAFKKILKYAMDDLSQWIRDAASDLADKLEKDPQAFTERCESNFYRYSQPSPKPSRQMYQSATPCATTASLSVTQRFQQAKMKYNPALTAHSETSEQRTPTQGKFQTLPPSTTRKRSGGDQLENGSSSNQAPLQPPARKRPRAS